jgi:hypothetical protein
MKRWTVLVAVAMAIWVLPTRAHHSIASVYDSSRQVNIEGIVTEFHFVYPHPFVTIDAKRGGTGTWILEMDNRSELARIGITGESLKPGDRIVVTGSPDRGGRQSLYIRKLERPADGFGYEQVGNSPRIRRRR